MAYSLLVTTAASAPGLTNSVTTSPGIDTSGADLIIMVTASFDGPGTVSDNKSNSWTLAAETTFALGYGTGRSRIFYTTSATPTVGSGHTFTSNNDNNAKASAIAVGAFSGAVASPLDQVSAGGNNNRASTTFTTGSITPTENNELVIAALFAEGTDSPAFSIDSGFSLAAGVDGVSGTTFADYLAYRIQSSATASNPTVTVATSGNLAMGIQASFKAATGGGGGNPWNYYAQQQRRKTRWFFNGLIYTPSAA